MKRRGRKMLFTIILLLVLFACVIPYGSVEWKTYLHKSEFLNEFQQTHMIDQIEYLKVFSCSPDTAQVLYVTDGHKATIMAYFSKSDDVWALDTWTVLWSSTGSAEKFFWPYYR